RPSTRSGCRRRGASSSASPTTTSCSRAATGSSASWTWKGGSRSIQRSRCRSAGDSLIARFASRLARVALGTLLAAGPAWAGFEDGRRAYDRADYPAAYREWLPLAEGGAPSAPLIAGFMLQSVDALTPQ